MRWSRSTVLPSAGLALFVSDRFGCGACTTVVALSSLLLGLASSGLLTRPVLVTLGAAPERAVPVRVRGGGVAPAGRGLAWVQDTFCVPVHCHPAPPVTLVAWTVLGTESVTVRVLSVAT